MSECYLGEIRIWAGVKIPQQWAICDGRSMPIQGNEPLYSLIGITYGGDGTRTFNLPNLQGMLPVGQGAGTGLTKRTIGNVTGAETVTLGASTLPAHNHPLFGSSTAANKSIPDNTSVLGTPGGNFYAAYGTDTTKIMALNNVAVTPSSEPPATQPHQNMMPATAINYIIALMGNYPQQA